VTETVEKDREQVINELQQRIEDDFNEKIAALDKQREKLVAGRNAALENLAQLRGFVLGADSAPVAPSPQFRARTLIEAANHVINNFITGDFDINSVIASIKRHHPEIQQPINPTSVSGILRAHRESGVLEPVQKGAGPKPAVYRLSKSGRDKLDTVERMRGLKE
jgi:hypothetical protein